MTRDETLERLLRGLLDEAGDGNTSLPDGYQARRTLLRARMNVRPPVPIDPELLALQDALLQAELAEKEVTDADTLPPTPRDGRLSLWRGDITALRCGAVVNAANSTLLGCRLPLHNCIDNAIHSAAGIQLRLACHAIIEDQGHPEHPGGAKLTPGYHLPARYVLHTVGPKVRGAVTDADRETLRSCYRSCLALAGARQVDSVAFCCISTGVYGFPAEEAAALAVETVRAELDTGVPVNRVIFNVFTPRDEALYHTLLF